MEPSGKFRTYVSVGAVMAALAMEPAQGQATFDVSCPPIDTTVIDTSWLSAGEVVELEVSFDVTRSGNTGRISVLGPAPSHVADAITRSITAMRCQTDHRGSSARRTPVAHTITLTGSAPVAAATAPPQAPSSSTQQARQPPRDPKAEAITRQEAEEAERLEESRRRAEAARQAATRQEREAAERRRIEAAAGAEEARRMEEQARRQAEIEASRPPTPREVVTRATTFLAACRTGVMESYAMHGRWPVQDFDAPTHCGGEPPEHVAVSAPRMGLLLATIEHPDVTGHVSHAFNDEQDNWTCGTDFGSGMVADDSCHNPLYAGERRPTSILDF